MRKRLTKKADPYTLGRDKENPPVEKYMTGDPSAWAEDVHDEHRWEDDTREETGHAGPNKKEKESPEWPKQAKEHALKSAKELKAKAINCVRIAGYMFPKASEAELETIGFNMMELSDRSIQATLEMIDKNEKTASTDDVGTELRELVARTKKLIAEAEEDEEAKEEDEDEEAKEEDDEDEAKEEDEDEEAKEDDEEMTEQEKKASVLAKKAKVLIAEAELFGEEGKSDEAEEKKKEAKKLLAKAKKVLAGEDLQVEPKVEAPAPAPAAAEEDEDEEEEAKMASKSKKAEDAPKAEATPVNKALTDSEIPAALKDKKEAALKHLAAAKKLMAEVEADEKIGDAALPTEHPAAAEEDEEEAKEGDVPPELQANADKMKEQASEADAPAADDQMEEGMEADSGDIEMDDIDMVPSEHDEELEGLFMSPDMKEAQEAYEEAFGKDEGELKKEDGKTASKKKGAKTLGAGVKISSASGSDELSNLWDCPPDVSSYFKN